MTALRARSRAKRSAGSESNCSKRLGVQHPYGWLGRGLPYSFLPRERSAHNYWQRGHARQKWLGVRPERSALTPLTPESALLIKTFRASDAR